MTHQPPVPEANQSPYPIQQPPHEAPAQPGDGAEADAHGLSLSQPSDRN